MRQQHFIFTGIHVSWWGSGLHLCLQSVSLNWIIEIQYLMKIIIILRPSIQPAFFSGLQRKMNFLERVYNFMLHIFHRFYADYQTYYASQYVRARFPQLPPLDRIVNDFDLVFTNTNPFVSFPQLLPPNVKEIGGIHIPTETPPLPKVSIVGDFIWISSQIGEEFWSEFCSQCDKWPLNVSNVWAGSTGYQ